MISVITLLSIIIILMIIIFLFYIKDKNKKVIITKNYKSLIEDLKKTVEKLKEDRELLCTQCTEEKKRLDCYKNQEEFLKKDFENLKNLISESRNQYIDEIENSMFKIEYKFDKKIEEIEEERKFAEENLNKIQESLNAGIKAQLREQEKEENLDFYKLQLPQGSNLADFNQLLKLKETFYNQSVISKLIWSQYFQKQTTDLCNRIIGKEKKCGIYKITNLENGKIYIGQSTNISDRWKNHCKAGIGIDTPSTNKLYQSMLKSGIWNFTFELLEECPKEQLNEKERQWIEIYQSNIYGMNTLAGNK